MINVKEVLHYGGACPFQLEGLTDKNEEIYVRYRGGCLRVEINNETVFSKCIGENETDEMLLNDMRYRRNMTIEAIVESLKSYQMMREMNDGYLCFDGYLTVEELIEETKEVINWPEEFTKS